MERLRVLFYVPQETEADAINHELVTNLMLGLQGDLDIDKVNHLHGKSLSQVKDFDLVHVFGCWSHGAAHTLLKARRDHVPTVYTPLGGLQPWVMKQHRSVGIFSLQRRMTEAALAVNVCGKLEYDTFSKLGWNKNVVVIKNPVLTSRTTFPEMSKQIEALYRKVLDTYARLLLTEDSCRAIGQLLQLGVDDQVLHDKERVGQLQELVAQLTDDDWRRIFIYAADEKIEDILSTGLDRLQTVDVEVNVQDIPRFERTYGYPEGDLSSDKLLTRNLLTRNKLSENVNRKEENERRLLIELLNLKYEMEHHVAPLRHLANVYASMRFTDMDEDRLNELVGIMGISDFAARLMTVMHDVMGLTEGFMPFQPQQDKTATAMIKEITKWNTY